MTALTPAQVREHARALILECVAKPSLIDLQNRAFWHFHADHRAAAVVALADAIRTARITVDWDEET